MEKRARELAIKERRERKAEKKRARKLAAAEVSPETVDADVEDDGADGPEPEGAAA